MGDFEANSTSVDAVIVNWNGGQETARAAGSAQRFGARVIVVDNGSTDGSVSLLEGLDGITVIKVGYNAGFARACNLGARIGTGDFVFLLNPDAEIVSGDIADVVEAMSSQGAIGVVGPRVVDAQDRSLPSVRRFPTAAAMLLYQLKLHPWAHRLPPLRQYLMLDFDDARPAIVDQVIGAAFIVPRALWESHGGLDEGYFLLFEEVDLARRLAKSGYRSLHWPSIVVRHEGHSSFRRISHIRMQRIWNRSLVRYSRKHLGSAPTLAIACTIPATLVLSLILDVLQRPNAVAPIRR